MQLPFSHAEFLDLFGAYNSQLWPAILLLWFVTADVAWRWFERGGVSGRTVFTLLAVHWAWSGIVYHWVYFRTINPAATLFAALFVLQALLFAWLAFRSRAHAHATRSVRGFVGGALVLYGLVYPVVGLAFGLESPRLPIFAVPCPTVLITGGLLITTVGSPRVLAIVPVLWAAVGSSAAFALGIRADLVLLVAGAALALDTLVPSAFGLRIPAPVRTRTGTNRTVGTPERDTSGPMPSPAEFAVPGRRTVIAGDFTVELDLTSQVLAIEVPPDWEDGSGRNVESATIEATLHATLGPLYPSGLVSASVLAQKAKVFDDGLYAAVEVAAQEGAGRHPGKARLLGSLGQVLAGADPAVAAGVQEMLLGAARLGQVAVTDIPQEVETRVQRAVEAFLSDPARSKPLGFYAWSRQLSSIFQQDRMLQGQMDKAGAELLAEVLRTDLTARTTYERHLHLVSRLTNPFAASDLRAFLEPPDRDAGAKGVQFLPPSVSHETGIVMQIYGDRPIPESFVLVDEMIRRIQSGELNLTPRAESGWYDHQTWSLEPLVIPERMPEGARLTLDRTYRELLLELFKGLLTLTRETHLKQLEFPAPGASPAKRTVHIEIAPALTAEPLVTFYLRRALSYRYVRGVLEESFGAEQLERIHRLTESGPVQASLAEELNTMETLFVGAHACVSLELGMTHGEAAGDDVSARAAADTFASWARQPHSDPDLRQDLRAMVPVFYDRGRGKARVRVFLGWSRKPIIVRFARPPQATVFDSAGRPTSDHPSIRWGSLCARLPYPVTAEVYVDRILDREEFRRLCDACRTRTEILKRLA